MVQVKANTLWLVSILGEEEGGGEVAYPET